MRNKRALPLDRDMIVEAAFALLQHDGLDGVSMRRLATRLNVQAPALYRHVTDKTELLALMSHGIFSQAYAGLGTKPDVITWLMGYGRALRSTIVGYRDGARLCAVGGPVVTDPSEVTAAAITAPLAGFGIDRAQAFLYLGAVISLALGWATFQANQPMRAHLDGMFDLDASFDAALQALVSGLARGGADR